MIDTAALGFALGAGLVAALNPCGFAFLPGYLGLVIAGNSLEPSRTAALARAGTATIVMSAGFLTVFGIFGMAVSPLIASAAKYLPFATVVIGVLLVAMAIWLLSGRDIAVMMPKLTDSVPTARLGSMYLYGLGYAIASLSCTVAPFLAVIGTTFNKGSIVTGILSFLAYGSGMAVTVGIAAIAVALAGSSATHAIRRILPHVGRIAGVIVLVTGLYVMYYGYFEIRLFFGGADANDPIVGAATAMQGWLARRIDDIGIWPLLGTLALLIATGVALALRTRKPGAKTPDPLYAQDAGSNPRVGDRQ